MGVAVGDGVSGTKVADGTTTVTAAASLGAKTDRRATEFSAGSLTTFISTSPGLLIRKEARAMPSTVVDSTCCKMDPSASTVVIVKRTGVPSGTRCWL